MKMNEIKMAETQAVLVLVELGKQPRRTLPPPRSLLKGVSWCENNKSWRVRCSGIHVGYFNNENEAGKAYDKALLSLRKGLGSNMDLTAEYHRLNFPWEVAGENRDDDNDDFWDKCKTRPVKQQARYTKKTTNEKKEEPPAQNPIPKYRGVSMSNNRKTWRASLKINDRRTHLGTFASPLAAANAYDKAAREVFGDKAILNFPMNDITPMTIYKVLTGENLKEQRAKQINEVEKRQIKNEEIDEETKIVSI